MLHGPTNASRAAEQLFSKTGRIRKIKIYKHEDGEQKGDCLLTYMKAGSVHAAVTQVSGVVCTAAGCSHGHQRW